MAIQTAGEQKYYDFIEERARSLRTGMIIWISLLAAALIAVFNSPVIGAALAAAGVLLGAAVPRPPAVLKGHAHPAVVGEGERAVLVDDLPQGARRRARHSSTMFRQLGQREMTESPGPKTSDTGSCFHASRTQPSAMRFSWNATR